MNTIYRDSPGKRSSLHFGRRIKIFALAFVFLLPNILHAEHYSGVSSTTGIPYPEKDFPGVSIDRAIIQMVHLDTNSTLRGVFKFRNVDSEYKSVNLVVPMDFYFHEFRPDLRSDLLEKMSEIFPDLFKVTDNYTDIRQQLKSNFGQRLFVRRFVSHVELSQMGIHSQLHVIKDDKKQELYRKKVFIEFKWTDPDRAEWQGTGQVLRMKIRITHELLFQPGANQLVEWKVEMPTLITGKKNEQFYLPVALNSDKRWNGAIEKLFFVHDMANATVVIPEYMTSKQYASGERNSVSMISNFQSKSGDRIAFFNEHIMSPGCTVAGNQVFFPPAVKSVGASSWLNRENTIDQLQVQRRTRMLKSPDIPAYEHLSGFDLTFLAKSSFAAELDNPAMARIQNLPCDPTHPQGAINMREYSHPVFAFDLSDEADFYKKTAWCEDAAGDGKGQFLEFELMQPARAIRIYNGYQLNDEKYKSNGRVRSLKLTSADGTVSQTLPVSDFRILNVYERELNPGKYKLTIQNTYAGVHPVTCLSAISFDFRVPDPWFNEVY